MKRGLLVGIRLDGRPGSLLCGILLPLDVW